MRRLLLLALGLGVFTLVGAGCPRPDGYRAVPALQHDAFELTTDIVWIPGDADHAIVLSKRGILWRVNTANPGEAPSVYLDIRERILTDRTTEEGLLGLAFAPDFAASGRLWVHYTAVGDEQLDGGFSPRKSVIARFTGDATRADASSHASILELQDPFPNHNGGAMVFGPDGYLYLSMGDGGSIGDPYGNAQRLDTLFGKILRIDVSGATYDVPPDNPFLATTNARPEIWAYGLRNPWRLAFDETTGALWTGDVGQDLVEEVDVIVKGGNYGWDILEGSQCYRASSCSSAGTIAPVVEYPHGDECAIIGGPVYHGAAFPELEGWYLYGDYCSGAIWGIAAEGAPDRQPVRLAVTGLDVASIVPAPNGELYLVTFESGIYRLERK